MGNKLCIFSVFGTSPDSPAKPTRPNFRAEKSRVKIMFTFALRSVWAFRQLFTDQTVSTIFDREFNTHAQKEHGTSESLMRCYILRSLFFLSLSVRLCVCVHARFVLCMSSCFNVFWIIYLHDDDDETQQMYFGECCECLRFASEHADDAAALTLILQILHKKTCLQCWVSHHLCPPDMHEETWGEDKEKAVVNRADRLQARGCTRGSQAL